MIAKWIHHILSFLRHSGIFGRKHINPLEQHLWKFSKLRHFFLFLDPWRSRYHKLEILMLFYNAGAKKKKKQVNPHLSATIDRSWVRPIRKGIIWSGEGSERPRSGHWLQRGADLQLENNDGCLGQHWWRGSTAPARAHLTCTRWWACMSKRVNHQNTLLC